MQLRSYTIQKITACIAALLTFSAAKAQYCVSNLSGGCGSGDYINSFSTTGGSTNISALNSGCNSGNNSGYSYIFSQSHTGAAGSTVGFTLQNCPAVVESYKIWVDWNADFDFLDAGEEVYSATLIANQSVTSSFIIPAGATGGTKRLRVRCVYNPPAPIEPCGLYIMGEIEDYDLVVTGGSPPPCTAPTGLTASGVSSSGATLSWGPSSSATAYEYVLSQSSAMPTGSGTSIATLTYLASGLAASTTYYFHVRTICGSAASAWATTSFTTGAAPVSCNQPSVLTVTNTNATTVSLAWPAVSGATGYEHANGTSPTPPTSGTLTTSITASYSALTAGTTYYAHVRTKCGTTFSAWRTTQYVKTGTTAVEDAANTDDIVLEALPNPVSDLLTVRMKGRTRTSHSATLSLTDMTGRVLRRIQMSGNGTTVRFTDLPAGMYLIRCAGGAGYSRVLRVEKL